MQTLRVRLLGDLQVEGCEPARLGRRQLRTLLKVLALRHGRTVSSEALADCLWGDTPPERANEQISVLISRLRKVTGPDRLRHTDGGYVLSVDWLDLDALAVCAEEAERRLGEGSAAAARAAATAGLSLYRGPLLADEADPWWAVAERGQAELLVTRLHRAVLMGASSVGDWPTTEQLASTLLAADPYDEHALRALMLAFARTGRSASALARYADMRHRLAEDLGVDPSEETEALHTAILLGQLPITALGRDGIAASTVPPGRLEQFAQLDGLLADAEAHGCQLGLLEGEAGMGKSHLLAAWAASLPEARCRVARASCHELGQGLPLQPLFDVVSELTRLEESAAPDAAVAGHDAVLRPFLSSQWLTSDATQLGALADPAAGQALLNRALLAVLRRYAERQTLVVMIDDCHLADDATLRWLTQAARQLPQVPLLLLGAARPEEMRTSLPGSRIIAVDPLGMEDVVAVVGPERAAVLHARSGGNPLFLVELAAAPSDDLPDSIRHAVEERCARAGAAAATLKAAAVVGPEVDLDLLSAATGAPIPQLLDHLEEGVRRRFLVEDGSRFAFTHAVIREALASSVGAARSAFIHRQCARTLAARPLTDPMDVARHARLGGELVEASAMLVTAARMAVDRFDYDEALRLVSEAITVHPSAAAHLERARIASVRGRYEQAQNDIAAARDLGGGAEVLEVAAWSAHFQRNFHDALTLADRGVVDATTDDVRTSCLALGGWVALVSGDPRGAEHRLGRAVEAPEGAGGDLAQSFMAWLRVSQGRPSEALSLVRRAEPHGLAAYRFPNAYALMAETMAHAMLGHADDALRTVAELQDDVVRMGAHRWLPRPLNLKGWIARNLGASGEADELNHAAIESSSEQGMAEPLANALLDLAAGRLMADDLESAGAQLDRADGLDDTEHAFRWRHQLRASLLRSRLELARGDLGAASAGAAALAHDAAVLGVPRYEVQALLVQARADHRSGLPVAPSEVDAALHRLEGLAGLEAWWIMAEVAAEFQQPAWDALARQHLAALSTRSGPYAVSLERAARRLLA